jgi:hypothetical protein
MDPLAAPWHLGRLDVTQSWRRALKTRIKFAFVAALAGAAVLLSGSASMADFELRLSDGVGDSITIDGTTGKVLSATGSAVGTSPTTATGTVIDWAGSLGTFVFSLGAGLNVGTPGQPGLDLTFNGLSLAAGQLTIQLTNTDYSPVVQPWALGIGGTLASNATLTYSATADSSNSAFGTGNPSQINTTIVPIVMGPGNTYSGSGILSGVTPNTITPPYSLTQTVVLSTTGIGDSSGDATLTTPEPTTVAMLLAGIPVLGFGWLGRRMLKLA